MKKWMLAIVAIVVVAVVAFFWLGAGGRKVTILQFNILDAGDGLKIPKDQAYAQLIKILKESKADVITISEVRADGGAAGPTGQSIAAQIAKDIGYNYFDQSDFYAADDARTGHHPAIWANAIFSKYPISKPLASGLGAMINVKGSNLLVFSLNLDYKPYPPYQLTGIKYENYPVIKPGPNAAEEGLKYATIAHGAATAEVLQDITDNPADAVIVGGDFNEPSGLDWTDATVKAGFQPLALEWPVGKALASAGFVDTFRIIHPDPVAVPAFTWTPTTKEDDKTDHHDRIDFIYARAKNLKVLSSKILGEPGPRSDVTYDPWPSDHRAVLSVISY